MRLNSANTSLWIVNYKRPLELYDTIRGWLNSFPFSEVNVICNAFLPLSNEVIKTLSVPVYQYQQWQREPWEVGSISQCWNLAMKKTFLTREWCIMSQDDVKVKPGWAEKINSSEYDLYIAPHGDVVQIQSLAGFKKIGWFDERFRAIGGPENDYLLRAIQTCPESISVHDEHIWQMRHNDVGLGEHFSSNHTLEALQTREGNLRFANSECFDRWAEKWDVGNAPHPYIDPVFLNKDYGIQRKDGWKEIDWYPSWTRKMQQLGRL